MGLWSRARDLLDERTRRTEGLRSTALRLAADEALPQAQRLLLLAESMTDEMITRVLGRDFDERLRRVPMDIAHGQTDPFGLDLETARRAAAAVAVLHRVYFRSEVFGVDNVPDGRVLLIANHSGQVPIDGMLIGAALLFDHEPPRIIRSMVEKWTQTLPFVGTFFQRVGQVVGVPENARRLLSRGEALLVFPEGIRGVNKPIWQRYQLGEFGLGFMRLALETETPIVPVAVVGAEEQYINLGNSRRLAKLFGMPTFPFVPQWLIPGAQLPLPTKYRIYFGKPLHFDGDPDDEDAVIGAKVDRVRDTIAKMLSEGLERRRSVFW